MENVGEPYLSMTKKLISLTCGLTLIVAGSLPAQNVIPQIQPNEATAFAEDFEKQKDVPKSWTTEGAVAVASGAAYQGNQALVLRQNRCDAARQNGCSRAEIPSPTRRP